MKIKSNVKGPRRPDPKTVEDNKRKFKNRKDPKLKPQQGDKNRPPEIPPGKTKLKWWEVGLLTAIRLLLHADDVFPSDNSDVQNNQDDQQQEDNDQNQQQDGDDQDQSQQQDDDDQDQNQQQDDDNQN